MKHLKNTKCLENNENSKILYNAFILLNRNVDLCQKRLKNLQCTTFYEKRDGIKRNTLFGKIKHCGIGLIDIGSKVFDATASCISRIVNLESTLQNSQKFLFMT